MNARGRARHRTITTALAVIVPVVFVAGLAARPGKIDTVEPLPALHAPLTDYTIVRAEYEAVNIAGGAVDVRFLQGPGDPLRFAVEFMPTSAPRAPDLHVYWTPQTEPADELPEVAILVGTLAGIQPRRFVLPEIAGRTRGRIVFYSLAHRSLDPGSVVFDPGAP